MVINHKVNKTIHLQFLTAEGCSDCENAKQIISEIKNKFPYLKLQIEEIDITSLKGLKLAVEHSVMSNPGIIINEKLFSTGRLDQEKFIDKILGL
ncbi:MAG: thioredoxin family protein [Patescibacteria group bacterium]